nr:pterin-4-alpha-carbinolamine dehydratase 2, mitochondrial-like isoform X2 [Coffea arabica]
MLRTPVQFQARLLSLSMAHYYLLEIYFRLRVEVCPKASPDPMDDLTTKKCVSCNARDMRPMTVEAAHSLIPQVQGWNLVTEDGMMKLQRTWKVKTFMKGMEFFKLVADVAEAEGHHPDLHLVAWNNVKIEIWTHAVGGLTENDFILAAKINRLDLHQLLSRKVGE